MAGTIVAATLTVLRATHNLSGAAASDATLVGSGTTDMKISVHKEKITYSKTTDYGMWVGRCTCGREWKFWFWGASVGYGLEHLWKGQHI